MSEKNDQKRREIILDLGECNCCMGCIDLNPEIFGWDDASQRPSLIVSKASEDEIWDVLSCCPGDCITLSEEG